jgi:hypothetical protein
MTAPCGLDCFNCPVYAARNNPELRAKLAAALGAPEDQVRCDGCRDMKGFIPFVGMTSTCAAYACAAEQGLDFCCDCADFPCDRLHPYADRAGSVPHNTKVFNLCLIKKMGLEKWAAGKAADVRDVYFNGKFKLTD